MIEEGVAIEANAEGVAAEKGDDLKNEDGLDRKINDRDHANAVQNLLQLEAKDVVNHETADLAENANAGVVAKNADGLQNENRHHHPPSNYRFRKKLDPQLDLVTTEDRHLSKNLVPKNATPERYS